MWSCRFADVKVCVCFGGFSCGLTLSSPLPFAHLALQIRHFTGQTGQPGPPLGALERLKAAEEEAAGAPEHFGEVTWEEASTCFCRRCLEGRKSQRHTLISEAKMDSKNAFSLRGQRFGHITFYFLLHKLQQVVLVKDIRARLH